MSASEIRDDVLESFDRRIAILEAMLASMIADGTIARNYRLVDVAIDLRELRAERKGYNDGSRSMIAAMSLAR